MSQFSGVASGSNAGYHTFVSEDEMLVGMNLCSFTKNSCREIYSKILPSLSIAYPAVSRRPFVFTYLEYGCHIYYHRFDSSKRKFDQNQTVLGLEQVYELIDYHDLKQSRRNAPTDQGKDALIHAIKNSSSGCLMIQMNRSNLLPGIEGVALIKLYFQDSGKRNTERVMVSKPQMMAGVPTTVGGTQYSARSTRNHQQDSPDNVGSYIPPSEGGADNPANTVAAPVSYHYNSADKTWESGTRQCLGKLLTDVAGAAINKAVPPSNVENNSDYYDPESPFYAGAFTTGKAMLMSPQNGNPHVFGPTIVQCENKNTEIVTCVNRSPKAFTAGEQVMLSYIGGEWIITPLGDGDTQAAVTVQPWSFCKYIATSDGYFKNINDETRIVRTDTYLEAAREKFYTGDYIYAMSSEASKIGLDPKELTRWNQNPLNYDVFDMVESVNFQPPSSGDGYYFTTVYDMFNQQFGGLLDDSVVKVSRGNEVNPSLLPQVINVYDESLPTDRTFLYHEIVFPFWGPVHSEGFTKINKFSNSDFYTNFDSEYFDRDKATLNGINRFNIPSEMASKILSGKHIIEAYERLGNSSYDPDGEGSQDIFDRNAARNLTIYAPFYESDGNHNHIQYIPLTDTALGSADRMSVYSTDYGGDRQFREQAKRMTSMGDKDLWAQKFFDREFLVKPYTIQSNCTEYEGATNLYANGGLNLIPYDCYMTRRPVSTPTGAPRYFRNGGEYLGANALGVVSGWSSFSKAGGGDVNFEVRQSLGLVMERIATGSSTDNTTIIPGLLGLLTGGVDSTLRNRETPQWGSASDSLTSFGTSALHVMIYDYWPESDTFFDPRYFTVIHFNPRGVGTILEVKDEDGNKLGDSWDLSAEGNGLDESKVEKFGVMAKYRREGLTADEYQARYAKQIAPQIPYESIPRIVDVQETDVDLRIPTLMDGPNKQNYDMDNPEQAKQYYIDLKSYVASAIDAPQRGRTLQKGSIINKDTNLRPEGDWNISTIRRGQFLSYGGFTYPQLSIGLNNIDFRILSPGSKFKVGEEIKLPNNAIITVTETVMVEEEIDEGLSAFVFETREHSIPSYNTNNGNIPISTFGEGFLPKDFSTPSELDPNKFCYKVSVTPGDASGSDAVIEFYSGFVWSSLKVDEPPKQQGVTINVALPSARGEKDRAEGTKTSTINLGSNNTGRYSIFTHFHNDITHTPGTSLDRSYNAGFLQYLDLNII